MSNSSACKSGLNGTVKRSEESATEKLSLNNSSSAKGGYGVFFWIKLFASFCLIGFVAWKTGLTTRAGWDKLLLMLRGANYLYLFLSLLCGIVLTTISSWKWQVLLRSKGIKIPLFRLVSFYFIGRFYNLFLPTSMGGDVVRVITVATHSGARDEAVASVFVERLTGMITLLVVACFATVFGFRNYDLPVLTASLFFVAVLIFMILWLVFDSRLLAKITELSGNKFTQLTKILRKVIRLQGVIREYKDNPIVLIKVFCISCLFYFTAVINVWVSSRVFVNDVSFSSMLLAVPAIMLVMNLPVSIGGLGLMEAAYALLFPLFGYTSALALSTALLMRFKSLVHGGVGAGFHLARLRTVDNGVKLEESEKTI